MYIGSAGPGRADGRKARRRADGREEGRTDGRRADGRTGGRTSGRADGRAQQYNDVHRFRMILNDSTTIFIDFHKKHPKTLCFSVVSRPAEAQVPIFTAQMKKASKKCQKNTVFFDFSNQANAQVPIFIDQNTIFEHLRQSPGSPGNGARTAARNPPTTRRGSR